MNNSMLWGLSGLILMFALEGKTDDVTPVTTRG